MTDDMPTGPSGGEQPDIPAMLASFEALLRRDPNLPAGEIRRHMDAIADACLALPIDDPSSDGVAVPGTSR